MSVGRRLGFGRGFGGLVHRGRVHTFVVVSDDPIVRRRGFLAALGFLFLLELFPVRVGIDCAAGDYEGDDREQYDRALHFPKDAWTDEAHTRRRSSRKTKNGKRAHFFP